MFARSLFLYLILFWVVSACKSGKQSAESVQPPAWTISKPIDTYYYYGVGNATIGPGIDHYKLARNKALEDLASEIEVNLEAQSVLQQKETQTSFIETYQSNIQIQVTENIKGHEPIESWSDENNYWVLYRLSKEQYALDKQNSINKAIERAKHYLEEADNSNEALSEIRNLSAALSALEPYFHESLFTQYLDQNVYLGSYALQRLNALFEGFYLQPNAEQIDFTYEKGYAQSFSWAVGYEKGLASQFPMRYRFESYGSKALQTNANGIALANLSTVYYEDQYPWLEAWIQPSDLLNDPIILGLLESRYAYTKLPAFVTPPRVFLQTEYQQASLQKEFRRAGTAIAFNERQADLLISIRFQSEKLLPSGNFKMNQCSVELDIQDMKHGTNTQRKMNPVKGVHSTDQGALQKARENAVKELDYRWIRSLISELNPD
jgi:hypothetical protein